VAETLEFISNGKAIAIEFTGQQLSPHAGSATFWGWLRPLPDGVVPLLHGSGLKILEFLEQQPAMRGGRMN
jgi:hypothetical protein